MPVSTFDATPLQKALAAQNPPYDPGPIDGVFGVKTQAAMQAFEEANDLPVTERPVAAIYIALGLPIPDFEIQPQPKGYPVPSILGSLLSGLLGNLLNWQLIQGYLRSALIGLGSWIGLDGFVGHDGTTIIIGALMTIAGVVIQAISNNTKLKAVDIVKAVDAHPEINVIPASETVSGKPIVSVTK